MSITLDGLEFETADFVGTNGLGHTEIQSATTGASGQSYPAEPLFPERVFRAALNNLGNALYTTSATSFLIGTGSKTFTLAASVQIQKGAWVTITSQANVANAMYGQVTAVSGLSLTVNVTAVSGSGTYSDWVIQLSGVQGATGVASDGDKGDITVSSSGTVWTIDAGAVTEVKQTLADNTTNDVSTSKHGYVPKAPNDKTKFLRGDASWAKPIQGIALGTGRYYHPATYGPRSSFTSYEISANELWALPIIIPEATTLTKIAVSQNSGTANGRFGIYNNSNGAPSSLVLDAGVAALSGSTEITISQAVEAGIYWLAMVLSANAFLNGLSYANALPILGTTGVAGQAPVAVSVSHTYGALPSSFGSATYQTSKSFWIGALS